MNRHLRMQQLAPVAPPCFASRLDWLGYLLSAEDCARTPTQAPLVIEAGQPVRFNTAFNFCADCDNAWRKAERVLERGVCRPQWLREQAEQGAMCAA